MFVEGRLPAKGRSKAKGQEMPTKRTKIVCTLGPAVDDESTLREMVQAGMDVARLNFSHGTHEEHRERIERLKRVREATGVPVALLLDTCGPEIRTGRLAGGKPVSLEAGHEIVLVEEDVEGSAERVSQTYPGLCKVVSEGDSILVDDGLIELAVVGVEGSDVRCRVVNDGILGQRKSVNIPGVAVDLPAMTEKDREDILFGIDQGIDFVAASFVRDAEGVREIRAFLDENSGKDVQLIAKIESAQALDNIEGIVEASDAVMVARGDLGVEVPAHRVPHIQKKIIRLCNMGYKPVITATQMLDSMIRNPRPTRAEVADVANAIYDGTDAIMLSGETAMGAYPVAAVRMMSDIAEASEPYLHAEGLVDNRAADRSQVAPSVGMAAVETAEHIGAVCIVAPTMRGHTARLMANLRPNVPIYAVTPFESVVRKMQLYWGVTPMPGDVRGEMQAVIEHAREAVCDRGFVREGDLAVFTVGDERTSPRPDSEVGSDFIVPANVMCVVQV